ncbi:MAG: hypothetical protein EBT51_10430, partial [Flavobacteriaceae bacterium]|nr:hypothetical protein [Flavobacteriaceae bacterium]
MNKTHSNGFFTFFTTLLFALFASQPMVAATLCDELGALEADISAVSAPVAFQDINSEALIAACSAEITKQDENLPRYLLQRGRGFLRAGKSKLAIADISASHDLGYPAGTFALATAYHLGDDIQKDFDEAHRLYEEAYGRGIRWAAKGLSMLHTYWSFSGHDEAAAMQWGARFGYDVPFNLTAKRPVIDKVLDHYQKECDARYLRDIDFDDYDKLIPLLVEAEDFYDIEISTNGLKATVVYADFRCSDAGLIWSGSAGSYFYIIVGDDIFEGWGFRPYSI